MIALTDLRRAAASVAVVVVFASLLAGCSDPGVGYRISGRFPQAVALFEDSPVLLMGVPVGTVESVGVEGDRVRIVMAIDEGVPLPDDVTATISPVSLIGERNVLLGPAWKPGDERIVDGAVIPEDRIGRVVEPDEVLLAIRDLVEAVDPDRLSQFLDDTAATLDGQGEAINAAIGDGATLLELAAARDDDLLDTAAQLADLASSLNTRDVQLRELFDSYARVTEILSGERERVRRLLDALSSLTEEGGRLVVGLQDQLPATLSGLIEIQLRIEANVGSVNQFIEAIADTGDAVVEAYVEDTRAVRLRLEAPASFAALLLDLLAGTGIEVECPVDVFGDLCPDAP